MTEPLPEDRKQTLPDTWTLGWWEKRFQELQTGYRGATHGINRAQALYDDFLSETKVLRKECETLRRERDECRAKIGELQARVERMAAFLNSQRKIGSTETTL